MSRSRERVFLLVFAGFLALVGSVQADMIEVDGRVYNGTILEETEHGITFKHTSGTVRAYLRTQLGLVERAPAGATRGKARRKAGGVSQAEAKERDKPTTFKGRVDAASDKVIERVLVSIFGYWIGDAEDVQTLRTDTIQKSNQLKEIKTKGLSGQAPLCALGLVLIFWGAIVAFCCGLHLFYLAFEEGFKWAGMILLSSLGVAAPIVGGIEGLVMLVPWMGAVYFVVTRWRIVRKTLVTQIMSYNLMLLGYLLIKLTL